MQTAGMVNVWGINRTQDELDLAMTGTKMEKFIGPICLFPCAYHAYRGQLYFAMTSMRIGSAIVKAVQLVRALLWI